MNRNDSFEYSVTTNKDIDMVIRDLTDHLKQKGFGILGTLDFTNLLKSKGLQFDKNYKLLEVCNPNAAKHALETDIRVGLLLPCTIAVYEEEGRTRISLLKPSALLSLIGSEELNKLGSDIEPRIKEAIDEIK